MRLRNKDILVSRNGNQFTTLRNIDKVARLDANHPFIAATVDEFSLRNDKDSLERLFNAVFRMATFHPDPPHKQYIRTPNRLFKDAQNGLDKGTGVAVGNCVDYSAVISAFLRRMKVPHLIRMVSFDPKRPRAYSHIYPVTLDGTVLDLVYGQDQKGQERSKEDRQPYFNHEVPYEGKFDKIVRA